jgi:hypothetical protein
MQILFATMIAMIGAIAIIAIVLFAMLVAYLGHRLIRAIRVYFRFRGTRLLTCPETHEAAVVEVAAKSMAMQAILDDPCLRLSDCSRWPMRKDCGQDCLRQLEVHPSEIRISSAWRPA